MVKKLLSVILSIAMLAASVPFAAFAEDAEDMGFAFTTPDPTKNAYANFIDVDDDIVMEFNNALDSSNTTATVSGGELTADDYTVAVGENTITIAFKDDLLPGAAYTVSVAAADEAANTLKKTIVYNTNPYVVSGDYILNQDFDGEGLTTDTLGLTYTSVKDGNTITPSLDGDTDKRLKITYSNMTTKGQTFVGIPVKATEGILVVEYKFELENGETYSPARQLAYLRGSNSVHTNNFAYYGVADLTGKGLTFAGKYCGDYVDGTEHFIRYVVDLDADKGEIYLDGKQINGSYETNMTVVPSQVRLMMTNIGEKYITEASTADLNKAVDYIDDIKIYTATKVENPGLTLRASNPANGASGVYTGIEPTLTFNNKINKDTIDSITVSGVDSVDADITEDGKTLKVTLPDELAYGTDYTIDYSGVRDIYGDACEDGAITFTTAEQNAMLLLSANPASGSTDAALNTTVELNFNASVKDDSLPMITINNDALITGSALSNDGKTLTLTLGGLAANTEYTINLTGVRNTEGSYYSGDDYTFVTKNVTPFTLVSATPADGDADVKITDDFTAEFSNKLDASTLSNITVRGGAEAPEFTVSANGENGVKIEFTNDLVYNMTYTVDFDGLCDEDGQTIDEEVVFTVEDGYSVKGDYIYYEDFSNTTVDAVSEYITFGTGTTASISDGKLVLDRPVESSATNILVNKLKDADGNALTTLNGVVGIEFRISMYNPEGYAPRREIARLIQSSNKLNMAETGSSSSVSRAFKIGGVSKGNYTDETEYALKFIVDTVKGQYEAYLDGEKVTETPVAIDSTKLDYTSVNSIVFVNSWGGNTRDPNGERTETIDDIKIYYAQNIKYDNPAVVETTPAADATGVGEELTATLSFDQEMDINTVTSDTVYLEKDGTKQAIAISDVTISDDKKTVAVKFADDLDFETTYSLVVNGVRSIYGKPASYTSDFTTRDGYLKVEEAIMSIDGKTITTLVAGEVSASVKIKNYSDSSNTAILILALYDDDAKTLENVATFGDSVGNLPVTINADTEYTLEGSITVPNDKKNYILRVYTWNSLDGMIPLNMGAKIESK